MQQRMCSIKQIPLLANASTNAVVNHRQMVQREIYFLLHLQHPRIVRLFDVFQSMDHMYLVMELAAHGTLFADIQARQLERKSYRKKVRKLLFITTVR